MKCLCSCLLPRSQSDRKKLMVALIGFNSFTAQVKSQASLEMNSSLENGVFSFSARSE